MYNSRSITSCGRLSGCENFQDLRETDQGSIPLSEDTAMENTLTRIRNFRERWSDHSLRFFWRQGKFSLMSNHETLVFRRTTDGHGQDSGSWAHCTNQKEHYIRSLCIDKKHTLIGPLLGKHESTVREHVNPNTFKATSSPGSSLTQGNEVGFKGSVRVALKWSRPHVELASSKNRYPLRTCVYCDAD